MSLIPVLQELEAMELEEDMPEDMTEVMMKVMVMVIVIMKSQTPSTLNMECMMTSIKQTSVSTGLVMRLAI